MPDAAESPGTPSTSQPPGNTFLPWHLVPAFKPGETDINEFTKKLEFLSQIWPVESLPQLAPRVCLMCEGSAFQKVIRIPPEKLKVSSTDGCKLVVSTLGGVWGRSGVELKFEKFERALYGTVQKADESNESYVARHEIHFEELQTMGTTIEEMRAYILIRNSNLPADDRKRIVVESKGNLVYKDVLSTLKLLGSKFFNEVQGTSKALGKKTYDINYVDDDAVDPVSESTETVFYTQDFNEEQALEWMASEGDEDALVMSQFEDLIIDCLQNDSEAAACLNAYTEARQKLILKAKSRGFWGKGGKDRSKGKSKGPKGSNFQQNRRPSLAQRIAESTCRICNQKGHWKWECPNKDRFKAGQGGPSQPSSSQAFAGVTSVESISPENYGWDVLDMTEPPPEATAFVVQECHHSSVQVATVRRKIDNTPPKDKSFGDNHILRKVIRKAFQHIPQPDPSRRKTECGRPEKPGSDKPLSSFKSADPSPRSVEDAQVFFATQGSFGIVDLGASLSVIGKDQFKDLCKNLPSTVVKSMKETTCAVNFRFGNDSVVQGRKAVFIPLGKHWLKIIVVPSNTPFLIANNVFRQFGAQIDTSNDTIWFRRLECTVPIVLSERKLYLLDVADLISRVNAKGAESANTATIGDESCEVLKESVNKASSLSATGGRINNEPKEVHRIEEPHKNNQLKPGSPKCPVRVNPAILPSPCHAQPSEESDCANQRSGQSVQTVDGPNPDCRRRGEIRESPTHDTGRAEQGMHCLRQNLCGKAFPNNDGGDPLRDMVCEHLRSQPPSRSREVHSLHPAVRGRPREEPIASQVQGSPEGKREESTQGVLCGESPLALNSTTVEQRRGRVRSDGSATQRKLGTSGANKRPEHRGAGDASPTSPDGRRDATGSSTSEPASFPAGQIDRSPGLDPLSEDCQPTVSNFVSHIPSCELDERGFIDKGEFVYLTRKNNWVAEEMWKFMKSKGLTTEKPCPLKVRADLVEIYCSSESELTNQARKAGSRATRHGLREGDLTTSEGRHRLYEKLFQELPMHVWLSPKCRAWCRWNVFNMNRNPQTATRVMKARKEDLLHLLLCDAVFQFQHWRQCHAHLEQPVGSEMLLQAELQDILDQSLVARCDMCVAGQLSNPETGERIRKGTQVLTTSRLMHAMLNQLRCDGSHSHHQIEGSIKTSDGTRVNLSQFTELYTRVFAKKVIRCMMCSRRVQEKLFTENSIFTLEQTGENQDEDDSNKRRKLTVKQPPTPAYIELEKQDRMNKILSRALNEAPKVGKCVHHTGPLIDEIQAMHTDYQIKCLELCKGTDRFRVPPPGIQAASAPFRLSIGIHRNTTGHFCESWEHWPKLTRNKLIRKSPPARLLITVFAQKSDMAGADLTPQSRTENRTTESEPLTKRHKTSHDQSDVEVDPKISNNHQINGQTHGPLFQALPAAEREALMRIHKNLGHPNIQTFRNSLISQGWSKDLIKGIEDMHCPACHETQMPKLSRPSHLSHPKHFNEVILIDEVIWTSKQGNQFSFYHILDSATNFQIAFPVESRTSLSVWNGIRDNWIRWAGPPNQIMCDSAGEFCSEEFENHLQQFDIRCVIIPAEAHWQMGKCERHGSILQHMLDKYQIHHTISTDEEFRDALTHCTSAKNSTSRHRGYAPEILVLGKSRIEVGSNSQSEWTSGDWNSMPGEIGVFHQNLSKRASAQKAFIDADTDLKLRRALQHRSRPGRGPFKRDQWVMFWRAGKGNQPGRWHGPAKVVLTEDNQIVRVTHLSRLYRCAPEHLRNLSSRESNLIDLNHEPSSELPGNIGTGVFQYHDLSQQTIVPPNPRGDQTEMGIDQNSPDNPVNAENNSNPGEENPGSSIIQPDSEPDQFSENSGEQQPDVSQIPIPDQPFSEEETGSESNALRAESQIFDHWQIKGKQIIRVHQEPRLHLFHPSLVSDCPIDVNRLTTIRKSVIHIPGQPETIVQDAWKGNIEAHQSMCNVWTGQTIFEVKDDLPIPEQTSCFSLQEENTAFEISLVLEEHEILTCTRMTHKDQVNFLASAAKRQKVEVKEKDLDETDRQLFLKAKEKEISSWLSTETVRKIARNKLPQDQILRSRWVLTWKPIEQTHSGEILNPTHKPKARLVILGYEDPHLESLNRDSPTMGRDSRTLILQYAASAKWRISAFDIQTAFLRGSRQDGRILGMEPPKEMRAAMKLQPWECCELLKSAYGLVNAPLLWYIELKNALVSLGMQVSPFDPCIFCLPKTSGQGIHGVLGIHVDDGLMAGDSEFHKLIGQLEQKYPFGSRSSNDFVFTGIHVHQRDDHTIDLGQTKYIEDISPINVERHRRQDSSQVVNETERQGLRGLVGSLQYATTNTRPDLAAKVSFVQSKITTACIADLLEATRSYRKPRTPRKPKFPSKVSHLMTCDLCHSQMPHSPLDPNLNPKKVV